MSIHPLLVVSLMNLESLGEPWIMITKEGKGAYFFPEQRKAMRNCNWPLPVYFYAHFLIQSKFWRAYPIFRAGSLINLYAISSPCSGVLYSTFNSSKGITCNRITQKQSPLPNIRCKYLNLCPAVWVNRQHLHRLISPSSSFSSTYWHRLASQDVKLDKISLTWSVCCKCPVAKLSSSV